MNKKIFQIVVEIAWVIMAIFCLAVGIYYHIKFGTNMMIWLMYALSVISTGMFLIRHFQRKNIQKRKDKFR
ncbi:MAG: hypothetical protein LBQ22_08190 [Bacteroidales bacterium]|jgi:hypothetical protein|nr:hypothetical protein [Bacteroidales bacterium]